MIEFRAKEQKEERLHQWRIRSAGIGPHQDLRPQLPIQQNAAALAVNIEELIVVQCLPGEPDLSRRRYIGEVLLTPREPLQPRWQPPTQDGRRVASRPLIGAAVGLDCCLNPIG